MAFFTKKKWEDRRAEFINRRTLTKEDGTEEIVTVARNEGTVSAEGDAFNAETMNNLEGRVEAGFNAVNESLTTKLSGCVLKHDAISLTANEMVTTFKECCAQLKSKANGLYIFEFIITGVDRVQMLVTWSGETSTSHGLIQSFSRIFFLNESECRFIDINVFNK